MSSRLLPLSLPLILSVASVAGASDPVAVPATPLARPAPDDHAGVVDDDFDDALLDPAWQVLHPELALLDESSGALRIQAVSADAAHIWYADGEGPFVYQEVTGNFTVTARVRAVDPAHPAEPPAPPYRLGGLLVRDPGSAPGARNSAHVAVGAGAGGVPVCVEDKSTTASVSDFSLHPVDDTFVDLRIERLGDTIHLLSRPAGPGPFTLLSSRQHPEFPATLQVGLMAYSYAWPPDVRLEVEAIDFR